MIDIYTAVGRARAVCCSLDDAAGQADGTLSAHVSVEGEGALFPSLTWERIALRPTSAEAAEVYVGTSLFVGIATGATDSADPDRFDREVGLCLAANAMGLAPRSAVPWDLEELKVQARQRSPELMNPLELVSSERVLWDSAWFEGDSRLAREGVEELALELSEALAGQAIIAHVTTSPSAFPLLAPTSDLSSALGSAGLWPDLSENQRLRLTDLSGELVVSRYEGSDLVGRAEVRGISPQALGVCMKYEFSYIRSCALSLAFSTQPRLHPTDRIRAFEETANEPLATQAMEAQVALGGTGREGELLSAQDEEQR